MVLAASAFKFTGCEPGATFGDGPPPPPSSGGCLGEMVVLFGPLG